LREFKRDLTARSVSGRGDVSVLTDGMSQP
jgi:hypothetical protein